MIATAIILSDKIDLQQKCLFIHRKQNQYNRNIYEDICAPSIINYKTYLYIKQILTVIKGAINSIIISVGVY